LRESGAIEQDADIVCFIHRPEYYTKSSEDAAGNDIRGVAEFIIAKHRNGRTDDVRLRFVKSFARFENWDENFNLSGTRTFSSKMNESLPSSGDSAMPLPPPPANADFLSGPDDDRPPF